MTMSTPLFFKSMLNKVSLPTLEEISLVTLAIQIIEDEEIKNIYCQHFSAYKVEDSLSHSMVCKVLSSLNPVLLGLPEILQGKILSCFNWIQQQYFNWILYVVRELRELQNAFQKKIDFIEHVISSVKWRSGVIDEGKSLHQLFLLENVKDHAILQKMFVVAAKFCLEDDLKILWEKISHAKELTPLMTNQSFFHTRYWLWKVKGGESNFKEHVGCYFNSLHGVNLSHENPTYCGFGLHIFEGNISGVKYFNELVDVDTQQMAEIIRLFLKHMNCYSYKNTHRWVLISKSGNKLEFLMLQIDDESILKDIFCEYFNVFFILSVKSWQWHKIFFSLVKMFANRIDEVLLFDLITELMDDDAYFVKNADMCKVRILWKNVSNKVKKSFCSYISKEQKGRDVNDFWKNMTIEVFDMFVKDEELRDILIPYENYGIMGCILAGRYDLIEFWLQKCLKSEKSTICYHKNFIKKKFFVVVKGLRGNPLNIVNEFLDWGFKYEDFMNRDEIFKIKDGAIKRIIRDLVVHELCYSEDCKEDLERVMDWIVRNRNDEYEVEFVNWKQTVIMKFYLDLPWNIHNNVFKNLCAFLSYGINDTGKIKAVMSEIMKKEVETISRFLRRDFVLIDSYMRFLKICGKDIFLIKKKVFCDIFRNYNDALFADEQYCENIVKLLYWNCENDEEIIALENILMSVRTKNKPAKRLEIFRYINETLMGLTNRRRQPIETSLTFISKFSNYWIIAINNILKLLFEGKIEDKQWLAVLFNLKMIAIEKLNDDIMLEDKLYYDTMVVLINWGKENEHVRKENWDIKKYFIKYLKSNIKAKVIPKLILNYKFVRPFFEGDEDIIDFKKILWNFKEFLLKKLMSDKDKELTCKLLKNFKGFSDFLNWNGFDEKSMKDLKVKLLSRNGPCCCVHWIQNYDIRTASNFLDWCVPKNRDGRLKISKLKKNVIQIATYYRNSKYWEENGFFRLKEFLMLRPNGDEEEMKRILMKKRKYIAKRWE